MSENGNKPAFVALEVEGSGLGLTKRELFAAMAMQGILGNAYWNKHGPFSPPEVAKSARECADALLAELVEVEA